VMPKKEKSRRANRSQTRLLLVNLAEGRMVPRKSWFTPREQPHPSQADHSRLLRSPARYPIGPGGSPCLRRNNNCNSNSNSNSILRTRLRLCTPTRKPFSLLVRWLDRGGTARSTSLVPSRGSLSGRQTTPIWED
jgi:hypothetical protein